MNNNQIAFRNSLAGKLFLQRVDRKSFIEGSHTEEIAHDSLRDAEIFMEEAINHQDRIDAAAQYEAAVKEEASCKPFDDCGACNQCDDDGYMSSLPGESFGAFLKRVCTGQATQPKQGESKAVEKATGKMPTTLGQIFAEFEAEIEAAQRKARG